MEISRARFLASNAGRAALDSLEPGLANLPPHRLADELRRSFPPEEASALAEQVMLRAKARERFGGDCGLVYSSEGLEMMTHPEVATRRARRLVAQGLPIADLTCGIGGDLRAVATEGRRVVGIERDAATVVLARANVPTADVVRGDATRPPINPGGFAVVIDPSRRAGAARRFDPGAFSPPWGVALSLARAAAAGVIKGPPGIDMRHVPGDAEIEFVQLGRSLREAAVWMGAGSAPGLRRAVLLPQGETIESTAPEAPADVVEPGRFVFDPEPCVTRAGVVRQLAHLLGARMMDPQVAYLTANAPATHVMAAAFEVLDVVPFSVGRLRARLRERGWRPDEIRRRAFPVEPDELRRLLGRMEGERVALLCTTLGGSRVVFIAKPLSAGSL